MFSEHLNLEKPEFLLSLQAQGGMEGWIINFAWGTAVHTFQVVAACLEFPAKNFYSNFRVPKTVASTGTLFTKPPGRAIRAILNGGYMYKIELQSEVI